MDAEILLASPVIAVYLQVSDYSLINWDETLNH